ARPGSPWPGCRWMTSPGPTASSASGAAPGSATRSAPCATGSTSSSAPSDLNSELAARRAQVLARLDDPGGHAGLGSLAPRPRVVGLLVADLSVDLEHAVIVGEHV